MTVGTGIFLASVVLGGVVLFIATKDRWNWKKIILWPLGVLLVLGVLGGGGTYLYLEWPLWGAQVQTTYWGISLGDSGGDVRFQKGKPEAEVHSVFAFARKVDLYWLYTVGSAKSYRVTALDSPRESW